MQKLSSDYSNVLANMFYKIKFKLNLSLFKESENILGFYKKMGKTKLVMVFNLTMTALEVALYVKKSSLEKFMKSRNFSIAISIMSICHQRKMKQVHF